MSERTQFVIEVTTTGQLRDALLMMHEDGQSCADAAQSISIRPPRTPDPSATTVERPVEARPASPSGAGAQAVSADPAAVAMKASHESLGAIADEVYARRRDQAARAHPADRHAAH